MNSETSDDILSELRQIKEILKRIEQSVYRIP